MFPLKQKSKQPNQKGFTIIEMLVVVTILLSVAIAITLIMKSLVISFDRMKRLESVKAQAQEASQQLAKIARMSDLLSISSTNASLNWRKANSSWAQGYQELPVEICESGCANPNDSTDYDLDIAAYFNGADIKTGSLRFYAPGNNPDHRRLTISFIIEVTDLSDEKIEIPFQTTVSLRSYDKN